MESKNSPKERRAVVANKLRTMGAEWAIISHPKHIFYLTGFPTNLNAWYSLMKGPRSTSFLALSSDGKTALLLGRSELVNPITGEDSGPIPGIDEVKDYVDYSLQTEMVAYGDKVASEMRRWLRGLSPGKAKKVAIEDWHLAEAFRVALMSAHPEAQLVGLSEFLLGMRASKGTDEIQRLTEATRTLDRSYGVAKENSSVGRTELDIYGAINGEILRRFGPYAWVVGDHASGERSVAVGGMPTSRRLKAGDTIILDLQVAHDNYWSDMCRTFVVGRKPTGKQAAVHDTLRGAMEAAQKILRPGTKGKEVYSAVSGAITGGGYARLPHHAGHAIGLDDQERPWFIPGEDRKLEEGAVVVVEPGVYGKETGGMRLEEVFLVTSSGPKKLSRFPAGLT